MRELSSGLSGWVSVTMFLTLSYPSLLLAQTPTPSPSPPTPTVQPSPSPSSPPPPSPQPKPVPAIPPTNPDDELNEERQPGDTLEDTRQNAQDDEARQRLLGDLPCLDSSTTCIGQLQQKAIASNLSIRQMDQRIQEINDKIAEAQKNGQKAVRLEVFKPIVQFYLQDQIIPPGAAVPGQPAPQPTRIRPLQQILSIFSQPINAFNNILSLIGVPLFEQRFGGSQQTQARAIAIGDLQIKVAELQRNRAAVADRLREQVTEQALKYEELQRNADLKNAIANREASRIQIMEIGYKFGQGDTSQMLSVWNSLDDRKAEAIAARSSVKIQVQRIKSLILGNGEAEE